MRPWDMAYIDLPIGGAESITQECLRGFSKELRIHIDDVLAEESFGIIRFEMRLWNAEIFNASRHRP